MGTHNTDIAHTHERRPAIWPWLLMPIVVLLVFFALTRMRDATRTAPEAEAVSGSAEHAAEAAP